MKETEEKKKEENLSKNTLSMKKEIIQILIPVILSLLLDFGICGYEPTILIWQGMILSIILMAIIVLFLTAVFKKTHRAVYIIAFFIIILSIINNAKLVYTNAYLCVSDINLAGRAIEIAGIVKDELVKGLNYVQLSLISIALIIVCIISKKVSMEMKSVKVRAVTGVSSILCICLLFAPIEIKSEFLLDKVFLVNERNGRAAITSMGEYYTRYGVLAGAYGYILEDKFLKPEGYDKEEIKEFIKNLENEYSKNDDSENEKSDVKPNIILMFQEAYWDITQIKEIEFDKDVNANIENLKSKGAHAKMLTPAYGGLSCNVEFELLTGGNLAYFGGGYNPFVQLYTQKRSEENPSIIKELKKNGYTTKVVFGRDYYDSGKVYERIGIDEYVDAFVSMPDYNEKIKGEYLSDEALVDEVLEAFRNKDKDEKLFYMTATIQSHMSYSENRYSEYDIEVVNSELSDIETKRVLAYAQGVYDTNQQIQRLYDEIQKMDEPTILIVLGDHLPFIQNYVFEDVLMKTSYFQTEDYKTNYLRLYTTDALILSNYDDGIEIETEYISPDLLITSVVNNIDVELSPFYKWLYETRNILPAQNQYLTVDKDSNIYLIEEELPEEMEEVRSIREKLQYYLFKDEL